MKMTLTNLLNLKCHITHCPIEVGVDVIALDDFDVEIAIGQFIWDENERFFFFKEIETPKYRGLTNTEISRQFNLKYKYV